MKLMSSLRNPYRSRRIVGTGSVTAMSEASLAHGVVWAQLFVLALCAARVRADRLVGPTTIEGAVACALMVILLASLCVRAIGWALRGPTGGTRVPRAPATFAIGSKNAHAR